MDIKQRMQKTIIRKEEERFTAKDAENLLAGKKVIQKEIGKEDKDIRKEFTQSQPALAGQAVQSQRLEATNFSVVKRNEQETVQFSNEEETNERNNSQTDRESYRGLAQSGGNSQSNSIPTNKEEESFEEVSLEKNTDKTFSILEQRVIKMASSGLASITIASMLNIDKSYVSQILAKEHIQDAVTISAIAQQGTYEQIDSKWDILEEKLLDTAMDRIGFMDNKQLNILLVAANNAKRRRGLENLVAQQNNLQITNITLPTRIVARYTTNDFNEITEVDGKVLNTMPSQNLLEKYEQDKMDVIEETNRQEMERISNAHKEVVSKIQEVLIKRNLISRIPNFKDLDNEEADLVNLRAEDL